MVPARFEMDREFDTRYKTRDLIYMLKPFAKNGWKYMASMSKDVKKLRAPMPLKVFSIGSQWMTLPEVLSYMMAPLSCPKAIRDCLESNHTNQRQII